MAKSKGKKQRLTPSQERYKREIKNLRERIKTAEKAGFVFPEDIIPKTPPSRVTKGVLAELKAIRQEKLYEKAIGFVTKESESIPVSLGVDIVKEQRKEQRKLNLRGGKKAVERTQLQRGLELVEQYDNIDNDEESMRFIRSLSDEDFEAYQRARKWKEGVERARQDDLGTGRQTGEDILPDEGSKYDEDEGYSEEGYEAEPEGSVDVAPQDTKRQKNDEEISDEDYKKWRENYERQKHLPKKDREYIYDGDAIYINIQYRLSQFETDYNANPSQFKRGDNKHYYNSFKAMLENEIKMNGFKSVMRRLDGHGPQIDTALETMLYDSKEEKVMAALMQLAEIIKGRILTQQESAQITAISEAFNYDEEDEDAEGYEIDELV